MDPRRLGDILLAEGAVNPADLAEALAYQRETGALLGQALLRLGAIAEERLLLALSGQLGLAILKPADLPSSEDAFTRAASALNLPLRWLAAKEAVIWFGPAGGDGIAPLVLAARNPLDPALAERIEAGLEVPLTRVLIANRLLETALARLHAASVRSLSDTLTDAGRLREMAEEAPVIDFVNSLFEDARLGRRC
jgi:general secretion pathway protein E